MSFRSVRRRLERSGRYAGGGHRDALRAQLIARWTAQERPERLRVVVAALAVAGLVLLALAGAGAVGSGPLAP